MSADENYEVVYYRMVADISNGDESIVKVSAKLGDQVFSVWIKPEKPLAQKLKMKGNAIQILNRDIYLHDEKLPSVSMKIAMEMFYEFLKKSQKPVLLVNHSVQLASNLLVRAFQKTNTLDKFHDVIAGFSNSLLIMKKRHPESSIEALLLPVLVDNRLGIKYAEPLYETPYDVDILKVLVTDALSKSDLIKNSQSYDEIIGSEEKNFSKIIKPEPSYSTSDGDSQQDLLSGESLKIYDRKLGYFRTISTGYGRDDFITKLAAKLGDEVFSVWIKPPRPIAPPPTSSIKQIQYRDMDVFLHNKKQATVLLGTALAMFFAFLKSSSEPVVLVAHFGQFEASLLIEAIWKSGMSAMFNGVIAGFSDSYTILKKMLPHRKMEQFVLPALVRDYLKKEYTQEFHKTPYDLDILEELLTRLISPFHLICYSKPYEETILAFERYLKRSASARLPYSAQNQVSQQESGTNPSNSQRNDIDVIIRELESVNQIPNHQDSADQNRRGRVGGQLDEWILDEIALWAQELGSARQDPGYQGSDYQNTDSQRRRGQQGNGRFHPYSYEN